MFRSSDEFASPVREGDVLNDIGFISSDSDAFLNGSDVENIKMNDFSYSSASETLLTPGHDIFESSDSSVLPTVENVPHLPDFKDTASEGESKLPTNEYGTNIKKRKKFDSSHSDDNVEVKRSKVFNTTANFFTSINKQFGIEAPLSDLKDTPLVPQVRK